MLKYNHLSDLSDQFNYFFSKLFDEVRMKEGEPKLIQMRSTAEQIKILSTMIAKLEQHRTELTVTLAQVALEALEKG